MYTRLYNRYLPVSNAEHSAVQLGFLSLGNCQILYQKKLFKAVLYLTWKKDVYRRKSKGRRCCMGNRIYVILCNARLFCTRVIWRSYCLIMKCYQCTNPIYACTLYNVSSKQCSGSRSHFSSWYGSGSKSFYKGEKPHAWLMHKAWFIKLSLSEWTLCV